MTGIRVGENLFECADYAAGPARPTALSRALQHAKEWGFKASCECKDPAVPLVIRRLRRAEGDRYCLAKWPNGGAAHAPDCLFHRADLAGSTGGREDRFRGIELLADGFRITPDFSLTRSRENCQPAPAATEDAGRWSKTSRASATILGVLEFLTETAGLHRRVETRGLGWREVAGRFEIALQGGYLGSRRLASLVYVVPSFDGNDIGGINSRRSEFMRPFEATSAVVPRFLVLGELGKSRLRTGALRPWVQHLAGGDIVDECLENRLVQKYGYAPQVRSPQAQSLIIGLFLVEREGSRRLRAVDGALMLVSRDYIPCDSVNEVRIANKLMVEGRRFEKPMRPHPRTGLIPDFVLLDTQPEWHMEVWGMNTEEYNQSKARKQERYRAEGIRLWEWDAHLGKLPPAFPAAEPK